MRPAYFVVQKTDLGLRPAIFWDGLPHHPLRDLEYVVRLDELPGGEQLVQRPLGQLFGVYLHMKRLGTLPKRWEPPKRPPAEPAKVRTGHREVYARRHLPDLPYEA